MSTAESRPLSQLATRAMSIVAGELSACDDLAQQHQEGPDTAGQSAVGLEVARAPGQLVLVVDDEPNAAELVAALLELQGHQVFLAHDPMTALRLAAQIKPEIAFLDIGLPTMTGFELADAMRGLPGMGGCRFVAISGFDDIADELRRRISGFESRLLKPISMETLARAMRGPIPKHARELSDGHR